MLQGGRITFSNGDITLHTTTTTTNNSKITKVTNETGQALLTSTITTTAVTLNFPGIGKATEYPFLPPLLELPPDVNVVLITALVIRPVE